MDDQNSYRPSEGAQPTGQNAIQALRTTRWILWTLMTLAAVSVPYMVLSFIGALWAAKFFDDSRRYYTGSAVLRLTAIPVACVLLWQFFSLDRTLRTVASDWRVEPLLLTLKGFTLIISLAFAAYWIVLTVGERLLIHLAVE
ncbi:MAG TPA: hypothetical protein VHC22_05975 [Pirellulales bacterium]|nr:hypothetical protein [Pirellulales bacterium]